MKKLFILLLLILATTICHAQNAYQIGTLPTVNLSKKLNNNWQLNFKTEFRQLFASGITNSNINNGYEYVHTDAAFITSKKVGLNNKIAGGFLLRFTQDEVVKRTIQQFTVVNSLNNFRLGHRFSSDQTFEKHNATRWRFRYRITLDLPLNGQTIDVKEWYLKISNEYLNNFQSNNYDLEIRATPNLGYVFKDNNKLEFGIEYRINNFINNTTRNRYWLTLNWYLVL